MPNLNPEDFSCPLPIMEYETIQLAHGSGGRLSAELVSRFFLPRFANETLNRLEDQAVVDFPQGRLALTTDSFVVDPLFFPGGDIGDLAINGTVNDVCMSGAMPLYLAAAFILEEGLPMATLHRVLLSMEKAARTAGVQIVTGDTKVVNRGCCDKLFITTTGVGRVPEGVNISAANLKIGDRIILSGTIGDHGMAILTSREGLSFASRVQSDTAALHGLVAQMLHASSAIHAMRDPTRGGSPPRSTNLLHPPKSASSWMRLPFRCGQRCGAPARCWVSIRCMSPTRASWWPLFRRRAPIGWWLPCGLIPWAGMPRLSARLSRTTGGWWPCAQPLARTGSSTCRWANNCPEFADLA